MKIGNRKVEIKFMGILKLVGALLLAAVIIYPFAMLAIISLKTQDEFGINPMGLPIKWTIENYIDVVINGHLLRAAANSLIITISSMFIQIFFGSLAAYALTKMNFKRAKLFSVAFLIPMIFPIQTVIITLYLMFKQLHLLNSLKGMIILEAAGGLPMVVFILTSCMSTIPKQISEAAIVDGASHFIIYRKIIFPLLKPAIATTIVISGLGIWNDYYTPLIMISDSKLEPMPVKVFSFLGQYVSNWPAISSGIVFLVLPVMILYIFMQRYIISGVAAGSVKG
jgi:raffinose/stachyose/melibiose transport system permease protein